MEARSRFIRAAQARHRARGPASARLVELTGIEPATYGLQSRRSPS